jgi:copper type II ascorbate-dependent monooxygenase-like protein
MNHAAPWFWFVLVALVGCGDDAKPSSDTEPHGEHDSGTKPRDSGALPAHDASGCTDCDSRASPTHTTTETFLKHTTDGWQELALTDWRLPSGQETYLCLTVTANADTYITAFKSIGSTGTHHATLSAADGLTDGVVEGCGPVAMYRQIFASGTTEVEQTMPKDVAMRIDYGQQIVLRLHLFNTQNDALTGRSGVIVKTTSAYAVKQFAGSVLAGTISLSIPPGTSTQTGTCTLGVDATVFNVFPHMHQLGRSMKAAALLADGTEKTLYDGPFQFDEQKRYVIDPLQMRAGDRVRVECTYNNPTQTTVGFGESSLDEMCFLGVSSYPPIAGSALCLN